jgi:glycosidase
MRFSHVGFFNGYRKILLATMMITAMEGCSPPSTQELASTPQSVKSERTHYAQGQGKPVIYQVFTRLFGNQETNNVPWGTIEQNGVGKFDDFTDEALAGIYELGTSYVWYTGVLHHALVNDYSAYGISDDDPDVVKGRAGSPYAIKDYYNVNPDLAANPANRMQEFEDLIARTHKHNMKAIIDIVPNHVARHYQSTNLPEGQEDFGVHDNTKVTYHKHNNFYYVEGQAFSVPSLNPAKLPLGGQPHTLSDNRFTEAPAKWTGNGSREAKPSADDWYETVRVNYGVRPNGEYDFPKLDNGFRAKPWQQHYEFWQRQADLPDSWYKMEAIVHFWMEKGVDGFRFDMAELVPVEFWSFLNSSIKHKRDDFLLLAEVYNPSLYRDYIHLGKMDYLYDKVDFYDSLKAVMQGRTSTQILDDIQQQFADIQRHLLHFLENHDEQRIASPEFVGDADIAKPALVVSALISQSPTLLYFGQEVGEDGSEAAGFGDPSRTSIFDYIGVPAHQRWMNNGHFDGGRLTDREQALRRYYTRVMNVSAHHPAMQGEYLQLHPLESKPSNRDMEAQFAFMRNSTEHALIVAANFSSEPQAYTLKLKVSDGLANFIDNNGQIQLNDLLTEQTNTLQKQGTDYIVRLELKPYDSVVLELTNVR